SLSSRSSPAPPPRTCFVLHHGSTAFRNTSTARPAQRTRFDRRSTRFAGSPRRGPCGFPHANTKRSPHPRGWGLVQAVEVKDSALVATGAAFAGLATGAAFAGLAAGAAFAGLATGAAFAGLAAGAAFAGLAPGAAFAGLAAGAGFTGLAAGAAGAALALDAVTEAEPGIGRRAHDTVVDLALEARLADGELLGLVRTRAR